MGGKRGGPSIVTWTPKGLICLHFFISFLFLCFFSDLNINFTSRNPVPFSRYKQLGHSVLSATNGECE